MKGFQLYFELVKIQLQSKCDVVLSVVHFMLVNENDFVCVGLGDKFDASLEQIIGSELLPTGWNANQTIYSVKYCARADHRKRLLLKAVHNGDMLIVSLVPLDAPNVVHSMSIKPDQFVANNWKTRYIEAFQGGDVKPLSDLLRQDLLLKLVGTSAERTDASIEPPGPPTRQPPRSIFPAVPSKYPNIGSADLDPLNRTGGGMLYDPFHPQAGPSAPLLDPNHPLPPGVIPPGARFDPIGPSPARPLPDAPGKMNPKGNRPPPPNPDHFPPPGGPDPFL